MKKVFLFAAVAFGLLSCVQSPEAAFEKDIEALRDSLDNAGLAVVVVKDNQIVYHHEFGYSDLELRTPLREDNLYRIASISKSFSATSMMQLIEKGLVTLDTDVSTLAGFPIRNPKYPDTVITLEMLLSHTSSLNDSEGYFVLDVINPETNPDWANCYNDYEPGTGYEYCNLNFNLVGTFIEKLSGERFDQYVVHHVLEPLGLYGGYCVDSLDASRFAKLYNLEDGKMTEQKDAYAPRSERIANYRFGYDTPVFSPTGGMKISACDLARYMMMHMGWGLLRMAPSSFPRPLPAVCRPLARSPSTTAWPCGTITTRFRAWNWWGTLAAPMVSAVLCSGLRTVPSAWSASPPAPTAITRTSRVESWKAPCS